MQGHLIKHKLFLKIEQHRIFAIFFSKFDEKKKYKMTFPFYVFQCHKNDLKRHKKEMKPLNLEARGGKLIRRKIYEREEARLLLKILL